MDSNEDTLTPNVDLSRVDRKIWLVKVPKYLSQRLQRARPLEPIGKITVSDNGSQVMFNLSDAMTKSRELDDNDKENLKDLPIEHKLSTSRVDTQTVALFSHNESQTDFAIEGIITEKTELCPIVSNHYLDLHKERVRRMTEPKRTMKQLDRTITVFKPISNLPSFKPKKSPIKKFKKDRETVRNMLFELFEKHQYYHMRDLERLTRQPVYYLKEVMREMCLYNTKNPHQYTWQLRPEFAHYATSKKSSDASD